MEYDVEIVEIPAQPVGLIRFQCEPRQAATEIEQALTSVWALLDSLGSGPAGLPLTICHHINLDDEIRPSSPWDLESGFPLMEMIPSSKDLKVFEMPGCRAATAIHRGDYLELDDAYLAVQIWILGQGLSTAGPPWEVYLTDPAQEPDSSRWETQIFWPLSEGVE